MAQSASTIVSNNPTGSIFDPSFLRGAAERAAKSAAQGFLGGFGLAEVGEAVVPAAQALDGATWTTALVLAATMAVLSIATSVLNPQFVAGTHERILDPTPVAGVAPTGVADHRAMADPTAPTAAEVASFEAGEDEGPKHRAE